MDIPWLNGLVEDWHSRVRSQRVPHAVMLTGAVGVGKRAAAAWLAAQRLGIGGETLPQYPVTDVDHADLRRVRPLEDKATISIDQIRALVAELALTSYEGAGKAVIIEPANAMTHSAANSLLKTLEEPRGDALLILVVDRAGKLPATIVSRCQRIDIAAPAQADALDWLDRMQPGGHWPEALHLAGGAPLAAPAALERLDEHVAMTRELADIAGRRASAVEVAARWAKLDTVFVLDWLARQVEQAIRSVTVGTKATGSVFDESVLRRMDRRNMFCYLDNINRIRGQAAGSFNVQLTLEGLLIDWSDGLSRQN